MSENNESPWKCKALRREMFERCISEVLDKVGKEPYVPRICLADNSNDPSIYVVHAQLYALLLATYESHERLKAQLAENKETTDEEFWQDMETPKGLFGG